MQSELSLSDEEELRNILASEDPTEDLDCLTLPERSGVESEKIMEERG